MARRAKGEGTLYQAKDKSWGYQYKMDGLRKTKRFQRKADAKAYIEALTAAIPVVAEPETTLAHRHSAADWWTIHEHTANRRFAEVFQ